MAEKKTKTPPTKTTTRRPQIKNERLTRQDSPPSIHLLKTFPATAPIQSILPVRTGFNDCFHWSGKRDSWLPQWPLVADLMHAYAIQVQKFKFSAHIESRSVPVKSKEAQPCRSQRHVHHYITWMHFPLPLSAASSVQHDTIGKTIQLKTANRLKCIFQKLKSLTSNTSNLREFSKKWKVERKKVH